MASAHTCLAVSVILSASVALAQESKPADDIRQVVDRAVKKYESTPSYQDTLVISTEILIDGKPEPAESASKSLAFVRPGKLALTTDLYRVISDGRKLWEVMDIWMEYREVAAPQKLELKELSLSRFDFFRNAKHPLLGLVLEGDRSSLEVLSDKTQLTSVKSEPLDGAAGKRVTGTMGARGEIGVEIWFDDKTGLIGEIVQDHLKSIQESAIGVNVTKALQRYRFKDVRAGQPIDDEQFAFRPDSHLDKVSTLRMPSAQELQQRLVGKPAPAFTGKYLDGKEAKLEDFKGRVLILSFWSLGCGPCIASMPTLQKVADKYADKPVNLIGVNLEGPEASGRINELLKSKNVSFKHLVETKPALAERFFIEGIPCLAIVDGKGIIQSINLGMANEWELSNKLDRLLKGESLAAKR